MKAKEIYNLAIASGAENDPRAKVGVKKYLKNQKRIYQGLSKDKKEEFDKERLTNPYADSRFLTGDLNKNIKTLLVGIDIDAAEMAIIRDLPDKIDMVISHHPAGRALAALDQVMSLQADILHQAGVPINIAEGVMKERIGQVSRSVSAANHNRAVDAARLLKIPFACIHTPADNMVYQFLQKYIARKKPETIGELIDALKQIPEYKIATKENAGPTIFAGSPSNRAGKIVVTEMTGGTEGAKEIYEKMAQAGVGTIIAMHMKDENREEAIKNHINVVVAGHIASDSLGMNLILDKLAKKGIKIIPCSGLIRVVRNVRK